jgi:ankyrin repeat protein
MTTINLAVLARDGKLTVAEVNLTTKEKLEEDRGLGYTVFYWACERCSVEVIEAILNKGVNIDGLSDNKLTALMGAALYRKWDIITVLLRRGANAKLLHTENKSNVLHCAAYNGAPDYIIKALIDAGADPNAKNSNGITPIDYARAAGYLATASFIEQYSMAPTKSANFVV